jgi:hypothetical protein
MVSRGSGQCASSQCCEKFRKILVKFMSLCNNFEIKLAKRDSNVWVFSAGVQCVEFLSGSIVLKVECNGHSNYHQLV